jgi:hypothetical protein
MVYQVPHVVVDYCCLGDDANEETLIVHVARDLETKYLFAHAVPRKGPSHMHGASELVKDIAKLGYKEIVLKADSDPDMKSLQEEVRTRRGEKTILEHSPVGESQSNGVAERSVQAGGEHVQVLRCDLHNRLGVIHGARNPLTAWLVDMRPT